MPGRPNASRIVAIGGSAGAIPAVCKLLAKLPEKFPFPILIVIHIGRWPSVLPQVLARCGHLEAKHPEPNDKLLPGCIFVAPPNQHMTVTDGHAQLSSGPRENRARPAVDPLFRSVARHYRERAIGVILSGELDDGVAGLFSLKARGGLAIVQDPHQADAPSMPGRAIAEVQVDYCLPVEKIGELLIKLSQEDRMPGRNKPNTRRAKAKKHTGTANWKGTEGTPVPLVCPDCNGPLYETRNGKLVQFHCLVGHTFSPMSLSAAHADALERAIWIAIRTLKERLAFKHAMADRKDLKDLMRTSIAEDTKGIEEDLALLEQIQGRL